MVDFSQFPAVRASCIRSTEFRTSLSWLGKGSSGGKGGVGEVLARVGIDVSLPLDMTI